MGKGRTRQEQCLQGLKTNLLVILTLVGAVVGFSIGFGVRSTDPSDDALMWLAVHVIQYIDMYMRSVTSLETHLYTIKMIAAIGIIGELYLRMLKMMIIPLIVASVITGAASMDPKSNGKISAVSLTYIMVTNFLPCIVGTILCVLIKPGKGISGSVDIDTSQTTLIQTGDIFADLLRNLLPDNIVTAAFQQAQTKYKTKNITIYLMKNGTNTSDLIRQVTGKYLGAAPSSNILGLIIVSSLFGLATSYLKDIGRPFYHFFNSASEIILQILRWLIWSTPVGVASLIAKTIASTQNIEEDFRKLGMYFLTVMIGLFIATIILMPIGYFIVRRANPFRFLWTIIHPIMIVFATSSTAIAIPETLKCLEITNGIDKRVTRFVVPFSATLGRCGSCMYISISCIFIIQLVDMEVDASRVILVILLTAVSSLAIPSVTGASLVTVIILLTALNIPAEAASLLFALEWFLDRARSVTNICVQSLGSVVTYQVCKSTLPPVIEDQVLDIENPRKVSTVSDNMDCKAENGITKLDPPEYDEQLTRV